MMTPEITNEVKELINKLTPALTNMIQLKHKSSDQLQGAFKMHIDTTYADIIKTIYFDTGFKFDAESEPFK